MSDRTDFSGELAEILRDIAARVSAGTAGETDARYLQRIAAAASGSDKRFAIIVRRKRGQQPWGAAGVDRRYAMARAIRAYMDEHQCTNEAARQALSGQFGNAGPETLRKAWQEMSPLLDMDDRKREMLLFMMRVVASGNATLRRVKR